MNTLYVLTKWLRELGSPSKGEILPPGAEVVVRRKCTHCNGTGITHRFICTECGARHKEITTKHGLVSCGHPPISLNEHPQECGVVGCQQGHHYYWVSLSKLAHDLPKVKDVVS